MINFGRVRAMIIRYEKNMFYNYDRISDLFYWPLMDLFIWGLTGLYFVKQSNNPHALFVVLTGLVFWIILWRAQYEININLLTEIWDKNIINIFVSPLTIYEWIIALLIFGFTKMIISFIFSAFFAFLLFEYNVFVYGLWIIPIIFNLLLTGWAVGFFVAALLIRYGQKIQTFAWTGIYIIAPFSALYYSVSILPSWAQTVALVVPPSYVFEAMREILFTGTLSYDKLLISFGLNCVYLFFALVFFNKMFKKSRSLGLGRLQ